MKNQANSDGRTISSLGDGISIPPISEVLLGEDDIRVS